MCEETKTTEEGPITEVELHLVCRHCGRIKGRHSALLFRCPDPRNKEGDRRAWYHPYKVFEIERRRERGQRT